MNTYQKQKAKLEILYKFIDDVKELKKSMEAVEDTYYANRLNEKIREVESELWQIEKEK